MAAMTELQRPHSILFPVDFSASATLAADCVNLLVNRFHSAAVLLHVLPAVTEPFAMLGESITEVRSRKQVAADELRAFAQKHLPSVQSSLLVQEGEPADAIAETAERTSADLLVMPTQGKGRFRRFLLGSTTAKILNDVPIPVLTTTHVERT
jgi:nucleotide-binding universal stress UspA family protein